MAQEPGGPGPQIVQVESFPGVPFKISPTGVGKDKRSQIGLVFPMIKLDQPLFFENRTGQRGSRPNATGLEIFLTHAFLSGESD